MTACARLVREFSPEPPADRTYNKCLANTPAELQYLKNSIMRACVVHEKFFCFRLWRKVIFGKNLGRERPGAQLQGVWFACGWVNLQRNGKSSPIRQISVFIGKI